MGGLNPAWLVGKTIERVEMNPYPAREHYSGVAHNPVIYFTDGSVIRAMAQETDWEPGVGLIYSPPTTRQQQ